MDAAVDQLAEALMLATRKRPLQEDLVNVASALSGRPGMHDLREWAIHPLLKDVRDVRNRATHHYYAKAVGPFAIQVTPVRTTRCRGSRELRVYCTCAVEHLEKLSELLDYVDSGLETT